MSGFIAQLVEHRTGIAEVTGYVGLRLVQILREDKTISFSLSFAFFPSVSIFRTR